MLCASLSSCGPIGSRGALALALAAALAGQGASSQSVRATPEPELRPEVTRAEIEAHVRYLASDELAGRKTGTEDAVQAARYLADVLKRCGVEPAGDDGTFLQAVPIVRSRTTALPELTLAARLGNGAGGLESIQAVCGRDFDVPGAAIDLEGLRVLVARSASEIPKEAQPETAIFVDSPGRTAKSWLEESGHKDGEGFGLVIRAGSERAGTPTAELSRTESLALDRGEGSGGPASIRIRGPLLERLRRGEIQEISLRTRVEKQKLSAFNVVGRIPGVGLSDRPELASEAVVVSAHYDHLGVEHREGSSEPAATDPEGKPDLVFNGADDDASGCAAVLEIAGALASKKPARTVILLLATGEEVGLLGTLYYLDHPAAPLEKTVANLNVEMIGRPDALVGGAGKLWLTGFELSDLGPACVEAGLPIAPDARPDQHFFERSDNIAFVQRGVVGQSFSSYDLHKDYHTERDEADRLDFVHMESGVRAVLGAVRLVADGKLRPKWVERSDTKSR